MASVFNSTADYILASRRGRGEPNVTFTGPPFVYEILVKNIVQYHPLKMLMSDDEKPEVGSGGDGMGSWIVEGCGLLGTKRVVAAGVECTVGVEGDDDSEGLEVSEKLPMQRTLKLGAGCSAMH